MRVDVKFSAVNGKSTFDGTFTPVTQHDGNFLAVDGFPFFDGNFLAVDGDSNFDGKSPLYRDRPPVRYFYVGNFTEVLPGIFQYTRQPGRIRNCSDTPQGHMRLTTKLPSLQNRPHN